MSTVGLTKAMRVVLERVKKNSADPSLSVSMATKLRNLGLVYFVAHMVELTRRGVAALAAPRMTQAELAMLERAEAEGVVYYDTSRPITAQCLVLRHIRKQGWIDCGRSLTPAGRTALNNVRAAMGSPDWKEGL